MVTKGSNQDNPVQIRVQDPTKPPLIHVDILVDSIQFSYRDMKDALTLTFHRTIRIPDNQKGISSLPPNLGKFPVYKVQVSFSTMPLSHFPWYQQRQMHRLCNDPFVKKSRSGQGIRSFPHHVSTGSDVDQFQGKIALRRPVFVGGINAVSRFPMDERQEQARKTAAMVKHGQPIQDYMVVPGQPWLDGIVCEDGKVRQFVSQPRGSGFSVEQQVTGADARGGIQVEIIPIKCGPLPKHMDVRFRNNHIRYIRHLDLVAMGLQESSTWKDLKEALEPVFGIPVEEQVLFPEVEWNHFLPINDEARISDYYFRPGFVLNVSRNPRDAAAPPRGLFGLETYFRRAEMSPYNSIANKIEQMSMAAGGLSKKSFPALLVINTLLSNGKLTVLLILLTTHSVNQTIYRDNNPSYSWDKNAAILFHIHILDTATFAEVTGKPAPATPISARTYAEHGGHFFDIWREEPTGIRGNFSKVKSIAALEEERAKEEGIPYQEEENVPQIVSVIGRYKSTFNPVGDLH
ncbi:hypothetical protein F4679DRAFT_583743 [Xylaria curta]|nr:hypothetical protein F4679DRAFT_583743 [Xylaria curta]